MKGAFLAHCLFSESRLRGWGRLTGDDQVPQDQLGVCTGHASRPDVSVPPTAFALRGVAFLGARPGGAAVEGCRVVGEESVAWLGGLPVVGEQFFEAAGRVVGNAGDEAARARRSDKRCALSPSRREGA
jgi:hypothetical protein